MLLLLPLLVVKNVFCRGAISIGWREKKNGGYSIRTLFFGITYRSRPAAGAGRVACTSVLSLVRGKNHFVASIHINDLIGVRMRCGLARKRSPDWSLSCSESIVTRFEGGNIVRRNGSRFPIKPNHPLEDEAPPPPQPEFSFGECRSAGACGQTFAHLCSRGAVVLSFDSTDNGRESVSWGPGTCDRADAEV